MTSAPFRFRDLPSEIRKQVYRNMLCSFDPPPNTITFTTDMPGFPRANHTVETGILRTNSEIHREAYDVMIKTNRFVLISSDSGVPLTMALASAAVPVVAENPKIVKRFKGNVLALFLKIHIPNKSLAPQGPEYAHIMAPCTLLILHRDLDRFCQGLTDIDAYMRGFSEKLAMTMMVAPSLFERPVPRFRPMLQDFFTEKTQQTLLAPLRTLRGFKNVKACGHVERNLADAVQNNMAEDNWSHTGKILSQYTAAKDNGSRLFQQRKFNDACSTWQDAALELQTMHNGSSWKGLVSKGGEPFVSRIADLYFLMKLNIAHIQIHGIQNPASGCMGMILLADDALQTANKSLRNGFWMQGYKYRPSTKQLAKLRFRMALLLRLTAEPGTEYQALGYIEKALQLEPGDAALLQERKNIRAWIDAVSYIIG